MIKRPVKRGDNQVFVGVADANGNQICVCESVEIAEEIIAALNKDAQATLPPDQGIQPLSYDDGGEA
jgi:hypothetical protein